MNHTVPMTRETLWSLMQAHAGTLVVMLYDEAIACLERACEAIAEGDIERRFAASARAADLIAELHLALDLERGGEIASNLSAIYASMLAQLPRINFTNDAMIAWRMIAILEPLRDAWAELAERPHDARREAAVA